MQEVKNFTVTWGVRLQPDPGQKLTCSLLVTGISGVFGSRNLLAEICAALE